MDGWIGGWMDGWMDGSGEVEWSGVESEVQVKSRVQQRQFGSSRTV
jgi:hypothetical protein